MYRALENQLLAALAARLPNVYDGLVPDLKRVPLKKDHVLFGAGESPTRVWFPVSGAASILVNVDRHVIEAALIGCEGAIGLSGIAGPGNSALSAEVMIEGQALEIEVQALRQSLLKNGEAYGLMIDYLTGLIVHLARRSICNKLHPARHRLANTLLSICEYTGSNSVVTTHADLARSIWVAPSVVSEIMHDFRRAGWLVSGRGQITILNQSRLVHLACGCHNSTLYQKHISPVGAPP